MAWSPAVEANGWELMLRFAELGMGLAIVSDFCQPPRGMVRRRLNGLPSVQYQLLRLRDRKPSDAAGARSSHTRGGLRPLGKTCGVRHGGTRGRLPDSAHFRERGAWVKTYLPAHRAAIAANGTPTRRSNSRHRRVTLRVVAARRGTQRERLAEVCAVAHSQVDGWC